MIYKKLAAIDIGSNAIRLLICGVIGNPKNHNYKKVALIRLPIRMGKEAFVEGKISDETQERFLDGMKAYSYLMKVHNVESFKACATSAMREAKNGRAIAERVREETGIDIEIIDGKREAEIIFNGHFKENIDEDSNYVYVDVGGGSTEISILSNNEIYDSKSFNLGTLRLLNGLSKDADWKEMKSWIKEKTSHLNHVEMIGSGGNINKIYKLTDKKYPRPLLYHELKITRQSLSKMSYEERMQNLKLNPDRADVIVPASDIYFNAMKWSDSSIMHVPKIGLADGMIIMQNEQVSS